MVIISLILPLIIDLNLLELNIDLRNVKEYGLGKNRLVATFNEIDIRQSFFIILLLIIGQYWSPLGTP
jgi:hypothetical protein